MAGLPSFPRTPAEFDEMFATDHDCIDFLARVRWPSSYQCCACGNREWWLTARQYVCCTRCRRQQSLKSGTVLQDSRYPLKTWLEVAWHVCEQKNGISALGLQRAMGFGSYNTAWEWLHRMRRVMVLPGRSLLRGEVEVDETLIGGVKHGKRGRGAAGKTLVLIAAEMRGVAIGRIRLQIIPDASAETLEGAIKEVVEPGSEIVTDGWKSYLGLPVQGYIHTISRHPTHLPENVGSNLLPHVHRVAALVKRWLLGTHQGSVRPRQLQFYLDEFVFRFNRRTSSNRGMLFRSLVEQMVAHRPITRQQLINRRL